MKIQKTELDYFDFSLEPGLNINKRISKFIGNTYVSVVTYYTGDEHIKQTYISLLNQTFPHWEWIIATSKSDDRIKELKKLDKRIKIIEIEEERLAKAQYVAAEKANSDILLLLPENDLIDKTMIECGYFTMITNPEGVWAYSRMVDFDKKKVKKIVSQTECANDAVACTKDAVYYGVDSYNMNDILQKEKIQLKNNGLWKFDLQTGNKEKIREQSPKELHVLGNKVYDETLKEVS